MEHQDRNGDTNADYDDSQGATKTTGNKPANPSMVEAPKVAGQELPQPQETSPSSALPQQAPAQQGSHLETNQFVHDKVSAAPPVHTADADILNIDTEIRDVAQVSQTQPLPGPVVSDTVEATVVPDHTQLAPSATMHETASASEAAAEDQTSAAHAPSAELSNLMPTATNKDEGSSGKHLDRSGSPKRASSRPDSYAFMPFMYPNGTEMFPDLTTSEQEEMALEAITQAEDLIVAERSDDLTGRDNESDGGYDSDGFSSGSTSAESSVRDYLYENGRRYHRFREGSYNFPNDDVEQEREDMKHAMVKLLCSQKLYFAPLGNNLQEILDLGTGTGLWAIEMGDQCPSAHVLGIDLSPIQPDWLPPNVRFMVDDMESPWLHPRNHFDFIHSRHTVMALKDWPRLFRRALEHLKPGGWIELQEIHHRPKSASASGVVPEDHPVAKFWTLVTEGLSALGVDLDTSGGPTLGNMMSDVGLTNITEREFHVPIGTWPKNKVLKTVGLYWRTILLDGLQAIALGPLTRGLRWNREQVELFLMEVRRAYHDNTALMYMPLRIVYAQKPTTLY